MSWTRCPKGRVWFQRKAFAALIVLAACHRAPPPLDRAGQELLWPLRDEGLHPTQLLAFVGIAPDARVADVGAGPGYFTLPLLAAVPSGSVLATDLRADYLAVAVERARNAHLDGRLTTRVVTVDDPQLPLAAIDLLFLAQVDHAFADRRQALQRMIPALAPHGRVVVVSFVRYEAPMREALTGLGFALEKRMQPSAPFYVAVYAR